MSENIQVSIITVSLNSSSSIEKTINSVINQDYPNIEYIIIDGGSNDVTLELINKYKSRIDYLVSEPDNGIYSAMNKGINISNGSIIFFLNTDDYLYNDHVISKVVKTFNTFTDVDMVYGDVLLDFQKGKKKWEQTSVLTRKTLARSTINHQTIFARRETLLSTNGFSEDYSVVSDYDWLMKFVKNNYNSKHIDSVTTVVGTSGLSFSSNWKQERKQAMLNYYTPIEIFKWRTIPRTIPRVIYIMGKIRNCFIKNKIIKFS